MTILMIGGGIILLVFLMTGDSKYKSTIEQMEESPEESTSVGCWGALSLLFLGVVAFIAVSVLAMIAKGV